MLSAPSDPKPGRHALKFAAQLTFGLGTIALLFTHYLVTVVEKPIPRTATASGPGAIDPETTGSIGNRASSTWLNPCSVLDRATERAH